MKRIRRKVWILLLMAGLAGVLGGCMNKSKKMISYMEERYGTSFSYLGETEKQWGSRTFTAKLSCEAYPDRIVQASLLERDGEERCIDNYMAVRYHEEATQALETAANRILDDYRLFFPVPRTMLYLEDPAAYSLESYLADPAPCKDITLITTGAVDQEVFQALMNAFREAGISVQGVLASSLLPLEGGELTEEDVEFYVMDETKTGVRVSFALENGELTFEDWG